MCPEEQDFMYKYMVQLVSFLRQFQVKIQGDKI